ncbi:MAG: hypothetical protein K8I82_28245, partial [Anaerolineae bacterium]|nr:hypothetical protein [Anaerolineae bacterium]
MTKLLKFVVLLLVIAVPMSAFAQELSEEDQANIEKALAALEVASEYPSYAVEQTEVNGTTITVTSDGETLLAQESSEVNTTSYTLTNGESPNLSGTSSVIGTNSENGTEMTYLMEAELRLVDGQVYVNTSYLTPDPNLPVLPEGWTAITRDDLETYPGLESLGLDKIFTTVETGGSMPFVKNFEAFAEVIRNSASVVAVETQTLEDGREVENITILLGSEGLGGLLTVDESAEENPMIQVLTENLTEDSSGLLTVAIDADGN